MRRKMELAKISAGLLIVGLAVGSVIGASGLIKVKVGQEFNITLESNPTTGYQWQLAKELDRSIVELVRSEYRPSESGLLGAGGTEVWTFKAVKGGTAEISFEYVRSWETDVPPIKEKNFGIIVGY